VKPTVRRTPTTFGVTNMSSVFICHGSEDKPSIVRQLASDLSCSGFDVWYDEWEIRPGDSLRRKIVSGLEACDYFLIVLSRRSISKQWVQFELDSATVREIEKKTQIIPIVYGTLSHDEVPPDLRRKRYVRFTHGSGPRYNKQMAHLLEGLLTMNESLSLIPGVLLTTRGKSVSVTTKYIAWSHSVFDWEEFIVEYQSFIRGVFCENHSDTQVRLRAGNLDSQQMANTEQFQAWLSELATSLSGRRAIPIQPLPFTRSSFGLNHRGQLESRKIWELPKHVDIEPNSTQDVMLYLGASGIAGDEAMPDRMERKWAHGMIDEDWLRPDIESTLMKISDGLQRATQHMQGWSFLTLDTTNDKEVEQSHVLVILWQLANEHLELQKARSYESFNQRGNLWQRRK
jgi:hypothetical protein